MRFPLFSDGAHINLFFRLFTQSSSRLARSSQPWMSSTMSSRAKNTEHGRRSTSPSCSSTWSSAWTCARVTWPRRVSTSTRTSASRCVCVCVRGEIPHVFAHVMYSHTVWSQSVNDWFLLPGEHQISGGCGQGLPEAGGGED